MLSQSPGAPFFTQTELPSEPNLLPDPQLLSSRTIFLPNMLKTYLPSNRQDFIKSEVHCGAATLHLQPLSLPFMIHLKPDFWLCQSIKTSLAESLVNS